MRPPTMLAALLSVISLTPSPAFAAAPEPADPRTAVLEAMNAELDRSMRALRLKEYEAPYFIAFSVRDYEKFEVEGKLGAIYGDDHARSRHAYVEVRVGSYRLDNTVGSQDLPVDFDAPDSFDASTTAPIDDDAHALRATLWLLADQKYKQALSAYAKKRGRRATAVVEDEELPSFTREPPARAVEPPIPLAFDRAAASARVREASVRFKRYPEILDGVVRVTANRLIRYLTTSEGTRLVSDRVIYSTLVSGNSRAPDGMLLDHEKAFYAATLAGLPDAAHLTLAVDELAAELRGLRAAPVIDPYTGPAILMQQAAGVFFHEAVGHRLEGERQGDEKEGRTFKGQIGKRILPDFLSIVDDPTLRRAVGEDLNGYYRFDDEGVAARPVTLVERGVLRDYLMSRTPITGSLHSNGHGRAEATADPMGRMANLVVRSTRHVSESALKAMLLAEVRRQHKPFGLLIRDITGGATNTANYGFQAFKGQPRLVYRVDAGTGAETLVRGVELVGTPLSSINRLVATSDREGVFNGYCGAESGYVPVSTVAPAVLLSEIELQRVQRALERPPVLPPPWATDATPAAPAPR